MTFSTPSDLSFRSVQFFKSPAGNAELKRYFSRRHAKAFAVSVTLNSWGWASGKQDNAEAEENALEFCQRRGVKCRLYATGNTVVWNPGQASLEAAKIVSAQATTGAIWRYYGDGNRHGVTVRLPIDAPSIISDYHAKRGVLGSIRGRSGCCDPQHQGVDIIGSVGAPVLAAADGIIIQTDFDEVGVKRIRIAHVDQQRGIRIVTSYIHLEDVLVVKGKAVRRGQIIGTIGVTGSGTTPQRPHLHFSVLRKNPHIYWHDGQGKVTCFDPSMRYSSSQVAITYPVPCVSPRIGRS